MLIIQGFLNDAVLAINLEKRGMCVANKNPPTIARRVESVITRFQKFVQLL